jgi:translation initiation factor 5
MSGGFVNIGGDSRDMNYRYRMPVLVTKVEGRGNGIKTVIVNMVDIAKALHIHPAYPTKFFGIELGAQSKFNVATERAIVNGCHQAGDLQKILERFVQQFILCPNCKLPELKMSVKSASIKIECAACGHASVIKSAHRLVGYMTKNPPKSFTADKADKDDDDKAKEGKKKGKKRDKGDAGEAGDDESASAAAGAGADGAADEAAEREETPEERAERKAAKKAKKEKKEKKEVR